jgi:hypothetical protein
MIKEQTLQEKISALEFEVKMLEDTNDVLKIKNKELTKRLSIQGVVSSFFTAEDVGNSFEIISNSSGHGFNVGETVSLMELNPDPLVDEHKFAGKDDYWWCCFADVKKL